MTIDVKDQVRRYAEYVDVMVPVWTVDDITSTEAHPEAPTPPVRRSKPVAVMALAFAAVLLAVGAVALLLRGDTQGIVDEPAPPPSTIVTTTVAVSESTDGIMSGTWDLFSTESGLPPGPVYKTTADPSGTVWALASDQGVYRFDGARWNLITTLPQGTQGGIWLAVTGHGHIVAPAWRQTDDTPTLSLYDGTEWRDLVAEGVVPADLGVTVRRLLPSGDVMVAGFGDSEGTPYLIRIESDGVEVMVGDKAPTSGAGGQAAHGARTITSDGVMWEGGIADITVFDGNTVELLDTSVADLVDGCCIAPLAEDPTGGMWIQLGTNLYHYGSDGWQLHATRDDLPEVLISSNHDQLQEWAIIPTPDGHVWVFHANGVGHYDGSSWTGYTRTAAEDAGIPVGRYGRLAAPVIGPDGSVWTITNETGEYRVHRYVGSSWAVTPAPAPGTYPNSHINGILTVTPDGSAWIATDAGLARFTRTQ